MSWPQEARWARLREMLRIAEYVQENTTVLPGNPTYWTEQQISWAGIVAGWCQSVGTADAYALAKGALGMAEGLAGKAGKSGHSALASLYGNLASLAISTGNDVEAARKYLEQGLKLRVKAGEQVNEEQEKRRWPDWDGKPPEASTTAPAGAPRPRG